VAEENARRAPELRHYGSWTAPCLPDNFAPGSPTICVSGGGIVVPETPDKAEYGPFLYLWLALAMLSNIAGIGSIVDGLVHWVGFFREALDIYRAWIREPLSWAVHVVWPSWWQRIPNWLLDLLVVWSGFFLAGNVYHLKHFRRSIIGAAIHHNGFMKGGSLVARWFVFGPPTLLVMLVGAAIHHTSFVEGVGLVARRFVFGPPTLLVMLVAGLRDWAGDDEKKQEEWAKIGLLSRETLLYLLSLIAAVIVLALLNWQFQHVA
jgi:hypothetical protein